MTLFPLNVIRAIFRQRLVFLAVLLVALAAAGAASFLIAPVWRASATLMIRQGADGPLGLGLLSSRDLHRLVVDRLGADTLYPGKDARGAADAFGHDLSGWATGDSGAVTVTYDSRDPLLAARVLESTLAVFNEQRAAQLARSQSGQGNRYRLAVDEAKQRLNAYGQTRTAVAPVNPEVLSQQRTELTAELNKDKALWAELQDRIRTIDTQKTQALASDQADQTGRYKVMDEARARLLALQIKEQDLASKYTDSSQVVVAVRDQIRAVQALIDGMTATLNGRSKASAQDNLAALSRESMRAQTQADALEARVNVLTRQIADLDRQLTIAATGDEEQRRLEDAVAIANSDLQQFQATAATGEASGVTIVERPLPPTDPVMPKPRLYWALGLVVGLLGGLGAAWAAEALSPTFADASEVERRLGLPVLATVPEKP